MHIEEVHQYCKGLKGVEETFPFGPDTLVFKVMGKVFALLSLDEAECRINLKCDPERALILRETYPDLIRPGYHMNKSHWNTVLCESLPAPLVRALIEHSHALIVAGLPKKTRIALDELA
jgi:predicted DNA-binding protein (MmcQ/YjbR family)